MNVNTGKFSKFLVAVLGTVSAGLADYYHGSPHNMWVPVVVEVLTALGVFLVPNAKEDTDEPVSTASRKQI
jgi:hypothetical protein